MTTVLEIVGLLLISVGAAKVYVPAGLIVCGVLMVTWSIFAARRQ